MTVCRIKNLGKSIIQLNTKREIVCLSNKAVYIKCSNKAEA